MTEISTTPTRAVLLVNLGTPEAPTAAAVRRYLSEFLHDHRVVAMTRWIWCPLLHFIILPLRGPKVAAKYAQVWMERGSPLAVHTADLATAVQARMPGLRVDWAMRYGQPSMDRAIAALRRDGVQRVLVLPLYPQYSTTTTASVEDVAERIARDAGPALQVQTVREYHVDPAWVAAVADSIRAHWAVYGQAERLLCSFHGIPQRLAKAGDPYPLQCEAGFAAIVEALQLPQERVLMTYQSRFGREPWLQPYTDDTLQALAREGVKTVDVFCPGFAVDCLETLEEISVENAHLFREAGGEALRYVPCLNASDAHADALAALARRHLQAGEATP